MDCILAIPEFIWNSISGSLGSLIQEIMEEPLGAVTSMILLQSREQDLRREMRDLMGKHKDLQVEIKRGGPENATTDEAKIWLEKVEEVWSRAEEFQIDFQRREGFSFCQLGCNVYRVLKDARRLMTERNDLTVLVPAQISKLSRNFAHVQDPERIKKNIDINLTSRRNHKNQTSSESAKIFKPCSKFCSKPNGSKQLRCQTTPSIRDRISRIR